MQRLMELRDTLRQQYNLKPSLCEQLAEAVAAEEYELAARLRDELSGAASRPDRISRHATSYLPAPAQTAGRSVFASVLPARYRPPSCAKWWCFAIFAAPVCKRFVSLFTTSG